MQLEEERTHRSSDDSVRNSWHVLGHRNLGYSHQCVDELGRVQSLVRPPRFSGMLNRLRDSNCEIKCQQRLHAALSIVNAIAGVALCILGVVGWYERRKN